MKNVILSTNPNYSPPVQPGSPFTAIPKSDSFKVTFSADFENEAESLKFTSKLLGMITGDAD